MAGEKMKIHGLKIRILVPMTLALILLLSSFVISFYKFHQEHTTEDVIARLKSFQDLFALQMDSDAGMMGAALEVILRDEQIRQALRAKDQKTLIDHAQTLYERLHSEYRITHFYFTGPDRVNILRLHKHDRHGDRIDRFTTLAAEKSGRLSYGIELGPLGTFTLRVVAPWYDENHLIGYVELGEEIEHITQKLQDILEVQIYMTIKKKYLNRNNWEAGMEMLGRDAQWDSFASIVIINETTEKFPEKLARIVSERTPSSILDLTMAIEGHNFQNRLVDLTDAGGRKVGTMVIRQDTTDLKEDVQKIVLVVAGICILVGLVLFMFFFKFLGRLEKQMETARHELEKAHDNLEIKVEQRTAQLSQANENLHRQAEFLTIVTESLTHPFYVLDANDYTIKMANSAAGALEENTTCYALTHKNDRPCSSKDHTCPLEQVKKTKKSVIVEHLHYDEDGNPMNVEIHGFPIFDDNGNVVQMIEYNLDITLKKQMEDDLLRAKEAAEAANIAKGNFLSGMSHELRTPLNAIIGFSEVLKQEYFGPLTEKQERYVQDILSSGKNLHSLVEDILNFTQLERGTTQLELSRANLKDLLEETMTRIREEAESKDILLDVQIPENLEALEIQVDKQKFKQIISSLLDNAVRFTAERGKVRIGARIVDCRLNIEDLKKKSDSEQLLNDDSQYSIFNSRCVEVNITDTGIGIALEDQKKIFNSFFQVKGGLVSKTPGTGLGLTTAKQLVVLHGGKIWVESEGQGKGSRFLFALPIK